VGGVEVVSRGGRLAGGPFGDGGESVTSTVSP